MTRLDGRVGGGNCALCECIPLLEACEPYLFGDVLKVKTLLGTSLAQKVMRT
jgi:hypothetical protein